MTCCKVSIKQAEKASKSLLKHGCMDDGECVCVMLCAMLCGNIVCDVACEGVDVCCCVRCCM